MSKKFLEFLSNIGQSRLLYFLLGGLSVLIISKGLDISNSSDPSPTQVAIPLPAELAPSEPASLSQVISEAAEATPADPKAPAENVSALPLAAPAEHLPGSPAQVANETAPTAPSEIPEETAPPPTAEISSETAPPPTTELLAVASESIADTTAGYALRFFGTGSDDIDRVKIPLDDPATNEPGPPADIGATDFTLEWWMRAELAENQAGPVECGPDNVNWIYGNTLFDRDRHSQDRKFGVSLVGGRIIFGLSGEGTGDYTLCGTSKVADGQWHHLVIQRRREDGHLWIFVDGRLEAEGAGPAGDVSYPDDAQPGDFCGGPCINSDPFLVIGAEKHDAGSDYPSFSGWIDEVRLSTVLRYSANFKRPITPFQPDADTAALWHFDEGEGEAITDAASHGLNVGFLRVGGPQQGPRWVISDAPLGQ
jgi:hypothetical protein